MACAAWKAHSLATGRQACPLTKGFAFAPHPICPEYPTGGMLI